MATPYEEGSLAHKRGEPMTENPYPGWMDVHGQWNDGWRDQNREGERAWMEREYRHGGERLS
jgi:hypothetical protein